MRENKTKIIGGARNETMRRLIIKDIEDSG
jgi:hypothetical protein